MDLINALILLKNNATAAKADTINWIKIIPVPGSMYKFNISKFFRW
tara:strand:- start:11053 stop:11190 length:138 start_codon:yes stop_codon:yes gene_type:complete